MFKAFNEQKNNMKVKIIEYERVKSTKFFCLVFMAKSIFLIMKLMC